MQNNITFLEVINTIIIIMTQVIEGFGCLASVLATITAILIALFGRTIEGKINRPKILLSINDKKGELTYSEDKKHQIRFYHLKVKNVGNRIAHNARLVLDDVILYKDGFIVDSWNHGGLFFNWKNTGYIEKNIGAKNDEIIDLFTVTKEKIVFCLAGVSNNFPINKINGKGNKGEFDSIECTFRLKYDEGVTEPLRIGIKWDGEFDERDDEMMKHFVVNRIA